MERLKTRVWRGGLAEILASSAPAGPAQDVTRILSAREMAELRQPHAPAVEPRAVQELEVKLRGRTPWRRLATLAGVILLALGGWCATRAGAAGAGATVKPTRALVAPPKLTVTQLSAEPVVTAAPAEPIDPTVRPRQAIDALAAGDRAQAAHLYRQLAARAVPSAAYQRAAEILGAKAH